MNRACAIILFCFVWQFTSGQGNDLKPDRRFTGLDTAFARVLKDWNCAGLAVAVVDKQQVLYAKGFGYADYERKIPVTPNTFFAAGSCIKPFTCALLGILRQEGKIDFDLPATGFLSDLRFFTPEMDRNITVRDMMTHRTGLPRHDQAWALFTSGSQDSLLRKIQFLEPAFGLREKWHYNNFMYLAQGKMIEALSGKKYVEYLREKMLNPIGMRNYVFSVDSMVQQKDFSYGYGVDGEGNIQRMPYVNLDVMTAVGGMNTSVNEMAKWVMLWLNKGRYQGRQVLPESYVQEAMSAQMIVSNMVPSAKNPDIYFETYGLGWFQSSYRGHYRVEHGGNISGFSTLMSFFPTDSIGIVIFCNQDVSNKKVIAAVRNLIADRVLKLPYKDWQSYLYAPVRDAKKGMTSAGGQQLNAAVPDRMEQIDQMEEYAGLYTNPGYGQFEIYEKEGKLYSDISGHIFRLRYFKQGVFDLLAGNGDTTNEGIPVMRMVINRNVNGGVRSALLHLESELKGPIEFIYSVKPREIAAAELEKYTGQFQLGSTQVRLYVKDQRALFLEVPGQPPYELHSTGPDLFMIKGSTEVSINFRPNGAFNSGEFVLLQSGAQVKGRRIK